MTVSMRQFLQSLSFGKSDQWLHFQDRVITGLSCDSRMVKSGDLFKKSINTYLLLIVFT
ncbi:MAG: hypothetical protein LBG98_01095 [Puniceicoccales bacterium]|jgi:hypothetical protein|nr:hypothetical protein [Puniceicoccales bacterium]